MTCRSPFAVLTLIALFTAICPSAIAAEVNAEAAEATEQRLLESVKYLSSDDLEGRGIGTKGLDVAADYLAKEFEKLGLETDIFDGSPFQTFSVTAATELGKPEKNHLALHPTSPEGDIAPIKLELGKTFTTLAIGGSGKFDSPLIFAGYGITAKNHGYDDYDGIDAKDKVVLILRKEPQQANPHSKFDGTKASQHATFRRKVANAYEHGAAAVIMVNDAHDLGKKAVAERKRWNNTMAELAKLQAEWAKIDSPTPEQEAKQLEESERLGKQLQDSAAKLRGDFDQLINFQAAGVGERRKMPVFFATRAVVDPLVKSSLGKNLAAIEKEIDKELKPQSAPLKGWQAKGEAAVVTKKAEVKNVIAVLPGEGELAEEYVIVGAHYDHLGMGGPGTFAPWTVAVHNGADDNASGTAALLEVARALAARDQKPKRSVIFMAFTAEERGLLGSAHYVKNPRFPLDATVAMLNMDMVGRLNDNKLIIQGVDTATEFGGWVDDFNKTYDFKITKKKGGFGPSDHASFYPKKIPVMHVFTGTHRDYHRPSDDYDKVNIEGMRRITGLVTDLTTAIADADERPEYLESKQPRLAARGGSRPYLGTIPDFAGEAEGYAIQGTAPGGPAEKGGMKGGDVIVKFGESKIGGLEDIDSALRKYKAGDKVPVVVLRDGKEVKLHVVLDPPK